ncbi:MAG TPA: hypothetical protein VMC83_36535 [Streptosporangiaceae bacterium]|nr:hypothetical protein [Streptosporangiaceae bacterium]
MAQARAVQGGTVELRRITEAADFEGQLPRDVIDDERRLRAQSGQQS